MTYRYIDEILEDLEAGNIDTHELKSFLTTLKASKTPAPAESSEIRWYDLIECPLQDGVQISRVDRGETIPNNPARSEPDVARGYPWEWDGDDLHEAALEFSSVLRALRLMPGENHKELNRAFNDILSCIAHFNEVPADDQTTPAVPAALGEEHDYDDQVLTASDAFQLLDQVAAELRTTSKMPRNLADDYAGDIEYASAFLKRLTTQTPAAVESLDGASFEMRLAALLPGIDLERCNGLTLESLQDGLLSQVKWNLAGRPKPTIGEIALRCLGMVEVSAAAGTSTIGKNLTS